MLDALRRLIGGPTPDTPASRAQAHPTDVRFAAAVLLVELATVDGDFSAIERQRITEILLRHFDVDAAGADALIAEAAKVGRASADDFVFTRQVVREYDLSQRMVLAELMWQVVLADGVVDDQESYLMRKLANLLQLEPAYLAEARKRTQSNG